MFSEWVLLSGCCHRRSAKCWNLLSSGLHLPLGLPTQCFMLLGFLAWAIRASALTPVIPNLLALHPRPDQSTAMTCQGAKSACLQTPCPTGACQ